MRQNSFNTETILHLTTAVAKEKNNSTASPQNTPIINSIFSFSGGYKLHSVQHGPNFLGFCLDSEASRSVIGTNQERSYRQLTSYTANTHKPETIFRFENTLSESKGIITLRLPLPDGQVIYFNADIVDADIPFFLDSM